MFPYHSTYRGAAFHDAFAALAKVGTSLVIADDERFYGRRLSGASDRTAEPRLNAHYSPFAQRDTYEPPAMVYRNEVPRHGAVPSGVIADAPETEPIGAPPYVDERLAFTPDHGSPLDRLLTELALTQAVLEATTMDRPEAVPVDFRSIITDAIAAVPSNGGESAFDAPLSGNGGVEPGIPLIGSVNWEAALGQRILDGCNSLDELLYEDSTVKHAPFGMMMDLE